MGSCSLPAATKFGGILLEIFLTTVFSDLVSGIIRTLPAEIRETKRTLRSHPLGIRKGGGRPHSEADKVLHVHALQKSLAKPMTWVIIPASGHHHCGLPRKAAWQHVTPACLPSASQLRDAEAASVAPNHAPLVSPQARARRQAAANSHNHKCQRKRELCKAKRRPVFSPHRPSLAHAAAGNRQEGAEEA